MRDMIRRARPDRFEDIIALVALYRPGPMDLIPDFIARKHGQQRVEYLDPRLEPILGPTYGIMVYQEQVMQIAQVIGGYTLGGADLLRRAMGKKKPEEMAEQRDIFVARRARRTACHAARATQLFDLMEKVRRLRLQQVARRRLRAARLPDGLHEDAPRGGIHGGEPVGGDGRYRQGAGTLRRRCRQRAAACCRRTSTRLNTASLPIDAKTVRYGLGAVRGTGESAIAAILRAARRAARSPICSTSVGASTSVSSTDAWSRRWCAPARSMRSRPIARG